MAKAMALYQAHKPAIPGKELHTISIRDCWCHTKCLRCRLEEEVANMLNMHSKQPCSRNSSNFPLQGQKGWLQPHLEGCYCLDFRPALRHKSQFVGGLQERAYLELGCCREENETAALAPSFRVIHLLLSNERHCGAAIARLED